MYLFNQILTTAMKYGEIKIFNVYFIKIIITHSATDELFAELNILKLKDIFAYKSYLIDFNFYILRFLFHNHVMISTLSIKFALYYYLSGFERKYILKIFRKSQGNISH